MVSMLAVVITKIRALPETPRNGVKPPPFPLDAGAETPWTQP
jgi:hypothetical protein